jgi:hypothetical protein
MARGCLLAAVAGGSCRARAPSSPFLPDYGRAQFAGSQGLLSLGLGKSFLNGLIEPDIDYGYVPAWAGGEIHVLSQSTSLALFPIDLAGASRLHAVVTGYSALVGLGNDYFLYRRRYLGYYWPSGLHFRFFAGSRFTLKTPSIPMPSALAVTAQMGAIDADLIAAHSNRSIGWGEVLTLALALNLYL